MRSFSFYFVVLVSFFLTRSYAQGGKDTLTMSMLVPQQAIKFSPLHLINFYPTIEISFEQKIASQFTLQLEGGYVLDMNDANQSFKDKRGAKLKVESRYYFFGRQDKKKIYYLAGEAYANIVNFKRQTWREECFDIDCDHRFIRYEDAKMAYREKGFTVKAGLIKYMGKKIFLDLSSGWTIRDVEYREVTNLLNGAIGGWNIWQLINEEDRIVLSPNLGVRIGYRFR